MSILIPKKIISSSHHFYLLYRADDDLMEFSSNYMVLQNRFSKKLWHSFGKNGAYNARHDDKMMT